MSFTIDYVIGRAREILQDDAKDRYSDDRLLNALNIAIASMQRVRPDIPELWSDIVRYPYSGADLGGTTLIPVHQQYMESLVAFVAGWAELADDEFTVDGRASVLMTRFTSQMMMGG
jgi:hypothetical protein